jgi:hypothetical protein
MRMARTLERRTALAAECRRLRQQIGHDGRACGEGIDRLRRSWAWARRLLGLGRLLGRLTGR